MMADEVSEMSGMVKCRSCDNKVIPPREYCPACVQSEIDGYDDGDYDPEDDLEDDCGLARDG